MLLYTEEILGIILSGDEMRKLLVSVIIGIFVTNAFYPFVGAELQNGNNENQTQPTYTIFYPPYDDIIKWVQGSALFGIDSDANRFTGFIGCAINFSLSTVAEAAAAQVLKINVGRDKILTITAKLNYFAGDKYGEINKIWRYNYKYASGLWSFSTIHN